MQQIWIIAKRELRSYFDSLLAYILIILFLGFTGFFTWLSDSNIFMMKQANLQVFFGISYWSLFILIPALTMRLIAEEKSLGTIEMLLSKPVSDWQVVAGKYLASIILISISLGLTLPYYLTVASIGPIDHGAVWTGYLGLLLLSSAYIGIGIFASSITNNQIVSFLIALIIGVFFHLLFGLISKNFSGIIGNVLNYLSTSTHYESITRGVIDSKSVIYFLSVTFIGLFASEVNLAKRNVID